MLFPKIYNSNTFNAIHSKAKKIGRLKKMIASQNESPISENLFLLMNVEQKSIKNRIT